MSNSEVRRQQGSPGGKASVTMEGALKLQEARTPGSGVAAQSGGVAARAHSRSQTPGCRNFLEHNSPLSTADVQDWVLLCGPVRGTGRGRGVVE